MPQFRYNATFEAMNASRELPVTVTVQAVNHYYRHSPPSTAVIFQIPPSSHFLSQENDSPNSTTSAYPDVGTEGPVLRDSQPNLRPGPDALPAETSNSDGSNTALVAGIVVLSVVAVVMTSLNCLQLYLPSCRRRRRADSSCDLRAPIVAQPVVVAEPEKPPSPAPETANTETFDHSYYVVKHRRRTPISCLRLDYEDRLRPNCHYALKSEFERIPSGPTDTADEARLAHNASLNRSQDVLPYDKNRVRLTRGRLADRTYINASLIRTVRHQPAIVVTQCPSEDTVREFWKTVWDFNIGSVVMLVPFDPRRTDEGPPIYWPRRTEVPTFYSEVEVELVSETATAHFVLRRFRLHGWEGECVVTRLLSHWQYVGWRSSGLPHHPVQFLDFLRDFQTKHGADTGMLIHCSLGAGPSGVFLALDALSTEGRRSGQVDVEECATLLCLERMNLIRTFRHYRYIYHCLIEMFDIGHDTCIPVSCFHFAYVNLIQRGKESGLSHLDHEFCVLAFPCYGLDAQRCRPNCQEPPQFDQNNNNNNTSDQTAMDDDLTWVLDGYLTSRLFVIPRRGTVDNAAEFWKAVLHHGARTAVVLRPLDQSALPLPCPGACSYVGEFVLECQKVRQNPCRSFLVYNLTVARQTDIGGDDVANWQRIRLYEFLAWPDAVGLPDVGSVLDLVSNVSEWCRRDREGRSTLFHVGQSPTDESKAAVVCAVWTVLDRIHAENFVDIYMAVRYLSSFIRSAFSSLVSRGNLCLFLYRVGQKLYYTEKCMQILMTVLLQGPYLNRNFISVFRTLLVHTSLIEFRLSKFCVW